MNFIKKILTNRIDDEAHQQFVRFGKGIFVEKAVVNFKKSGTKIKVTTSFELANDLVLFVFELVDKALVSGIVLARQQIPSLGAGKKKSKLFEYEINKEMNSKEINDIAKSAYFMLLDCSAGGIDLKIKKKLPKPGKREGKVNDKFCILEADLKYEPKIREEFLFDLKGEADSAKKIEIKHSFLINDIILPQGEKDFEKIRLLAKKKGKIIREISIDGRIIRREMPFTA
jgi:hypothetical protein